MPVVLVWLNAAGMNAIDRTNSGRHDGIGQAWPDLIRDAQSTGSRDA